MHKRAKELGIETDKLEDS